MTTIIIQKVKKKRNKSKGGKKECGQNYYFTFHEYTYRDQCILI